jgi:hypothetical protein
MVSSLQEDRAANGVAQWDFFDQGEGIEAKFGSCSCKHLRSA